MRDLPIDGFCVVLTTRAGRAIGCCRVAKSRDENPRFGEGDGNVHCEGFANRIRTTRGRCEGVEHRGNSICVKTITRVRRPLQLLRSCSRNSQ